MTHTPGPWKIEERQIDDYYVNIQAKVETIAAVLTMDPVYPTKKEMANARLITAAPDLLEALKELVAVPNKHRPDRVWDEARAAIAKAEGR